MGLRFPADAPVNVEYGYLVCIRYLLEVLSVPCDECDVILKCDRDGGLLAGSCVDSRPPVITPPAAVRVGLQEHEQVILHPYLAGHLPRNHDTRADPGRGMVRECGCQAVPGREFASGKQLMRVSSSRLID